MSGQVGRFICGVAALVYDPAAARYLLLRRADDKDSGAGEWECVTGRVDQGESFEDATHREVREEIGVEVAIRFIIGTTHFYRGPASPENELLGVKYFCTISEGDAARVRLSAEHSAMRWLTADEIYALLPGDHWLVATVRLGDALWQNLSPAARVLLAAPFAE
jgi:8-oxo-dGTP diphosphatase